MKGALQVPVSIQFNLISQETNAIYVIYTKSSLVKQFQTSCYWLVKILSKCDKLLKSLKDNIFFTAFCESFTCSFSRIMASQIRIVICFNFFHKTYLICCIVAYVLLIQSQIQVMESISELNLTYNPIGRDINVVLSRLLGFRSVPPVAGRRIHMVDELQNAIQHSKHTTFYTSPGRVATLITLSLG